MPCAMKMMLDSTTSKLGNDEERSNGSHHCIGSVRTTKVLFDQSPHLFLLIPKRIDLMQD